MSQVQTSNAIELDPIAQSNEPETRPRRFKSERDLKAIEGSDEAALSWYFGQGLSVYEKSTFGAVLQRITLDGFSSGPCGSCEGSGIMENGGFAVSTRCKRCNGTGAHGEHKKLCDDCRGSGVVEPFEVRAEHGGWCDSCRGSGCTSMARRDKKRPRCLSCVGAPHLASPPRGTKRTRAEHIARKSSKNAARAQCGECLGTGWPPDTVIPKTQADSGAGIMPDDSALTRFAITSRRLGQVRDQSPALYAALECFYGDVGARWGREDFGRLFALYALTPSGKKLARWGETKRTHEEPTQTAQERVGVQAVLERTQPKRERTVLLMAANKQASELYARAAQAWNHAQPAQTDRLLKQLAKRFQDAGMLNAATHLYIQAKGR